MHRTPSKVVIETARPAGLDCSACGLASSVSLNYGRGLGRHRTNRQTDRQTNYWPYHQ